MTKVEHDPPMTAPSVYYYQKGCRCDECKYLRKLAGQRERANRKLRDDKKIPEVHVKMPDWELQMLRRAVGLIP